MPDYPILPLSPAWNTSSTEQAIVVTSQHGKGGVILRERRGIHSISKTFELSAVIYNWPEVDSFLKGRSGRPFRLSLNGGATSDGTLWVMLAYSRKNLGVSGGRGLDEISGTLTQQQRLRVA